MTLRAHDFRRIATPYENDPLFHLVAFLVTGVGDDASTDPGDVCGNVTWTANGNASVTDARSIFGGSSLSFDGNGDYFQSTQDAALSPGTGTWCVEGFYFPTAANANGFLADFRVGAGNSFMAWCSQSGNSNKLGYSNEGGTGFAASSMQFTLNAWNHWAISRDASNNVRGFIGGALGFTTTDSRTFAASIGCRLGSSSAASQGCIGNQQYVRYTVGDPRYTAAFTPPAAPFTRPPFPHY